ncbi:hypothetical protein [Cellulomonas soli]|uniref:Uncharacterized protein n=1 Tax=Cellulomonas soli TaxID=931535 RepID=A0A512PCR5_9CELL|nr:hypothetical protein [Cellulomonas soli]NYI58566.1 hypothetical protein [Cellulomonas soli]GEP68991.1 hypothetical protein CSO01_17060 [Cellulomonas soli]
MTDVPEPAGCPPADRDVQKVLRGESVADAKDVEVLAAVQDALLSVPAGSPTSWFEVPKQRRPKLGGDLTQRRTS